MQQKGILLVISIMVGNHSAKVGKKLASIAVQSNGLKAILALYRVGQIK